MARLNWWTRLMDRVLLFASVKLMNRRTASRHAAMYRRTGGKVGGKIGEMPVLLLTTTGRKSGQPRTVPLNYFPDGKNYVVTASNSGRDEPPLWYLNLQSNPQATVQVGRATKPVIAKEATPQEKARLWPILTRKARQYAEYQKLTQRDIPMVVLRPNQFSKSDRGQ
ncbi:MAG TPA: nitroreductase family deazaflavin-dependent oxidoreductase [Chloroflexia bacterium]|nr:nitroreductase family deazaflavin-dependent oxidoreductase [Chloroflexia bacterium]